MPKKSLVLGQTTYTFDARPDRLDLRDRPYVPRLGNLPGRYPSDAVIRQWLPAYTRSGLVLDQGSDGACTGFGLAAVINYLLFTRSLEGEPGAFDSVSPAMLYQLARLYDEWPGEDYDGSSCRGALKGWHRHGVCRAALWPYAAGAKPRPVEDPAHPDDRTRNWDVDALDCTLGVYYRVESRSIVDMQSALCETGALYVSASVHEGWDVKTGKAVRGHDSLVSITHVAKPTDPGGHAFALVGFNHLGFVVQNSWGTGWGSGGFALLPYEDWVANGDDAWVLTLGVSRLAALQAQAAGGSAKKPSKARAARGLRAPRFFVPSMEASDTSRIERPLGLMAASDALQRRYADVLPKHRPLDADEAYRHALVFDRGFPVCNDITAAGPREALEAAVLARPRAWRQQNVQAGSPLKLLVYAHGGLNSESDSIQRVRALAPYALEAGLYPLFLTWRSGPLETVSDMVEEVFARLGFGTAAALPARGWFERVTEKTDRLLEPILRPPGGALWQQMKLNATRASEHAEGGSRRMVDCLRQLAQDPGGIELHLVGHSAGAIVLGALLPLLTQAQLGVASLRLFAPACTTRFALERYVPAVKNGTLARASWFIHVLSDENERADSVGPYQKSLLYLVSRAFEDEHKTPLLGLWNSFDPGSIAKGVWSEAGNADVQAWIAFWNGHKAGQTNRVVLAEHKVSNGVGAIDASHSCFDNSVAILGETLSFAAQKAVGIERLDY